MKTTRRLPILLTILAALAGLVFFGEPNGGTSSLDIVEARFHPSTSEETANVRDGEVSSAPAQSSALLVLRPRGNPTAAVAGFEPRDWTPPPPPAPPPPVMTPMPAQAPVMPFTFIGKKLEDGKWVVFLADREQTHIASEGATIASSYRIDKIEPPTLTLTYLPLRQQQTFSIGSAE